MGYAEDHFYDDYLRRNLHLLNRIKVNEMLNQLRGTFTISNGEQLERHLDREGNTNTVFNFLNDLRRRDDWVNHLLQALWNCEHRELYYTLRDEYRLLRPKSVWEPPPPPYSSHSLPPNPYDNPKLDSPRGYASLPIQLNPSSLEPQPGAPVAPSRSSVQPQESSDPSTRPRAPSPIAIAEQQALPYAVAQPDEVDTRTSADGISKTPVPETSPSPLFLESNGVLSKATNPTEQYSSAAASLPARQDIAMRHPLQEKSENPEVVGSDVSSPFSSPSGSMSAINNAWTPPQQRQVAGYSQVVGSDVSSPFSSPSSSMGAINNAWTPPQQREVPGYSQVASTPPPGQQYTANAFSQRHPVESVPNPVADAPSQRPSVSSSESGANAGAGHRQQPTYESSVQPSSCRPTDVDKPGVLQSVDGFADVTRETDEVAPLSRVPELEISVDDSSNGGSQCSSSSQPSAARASNGSPTPRDVPTTSTPSNASSGRVLTKRPEENEDPTRASSSVHSKDPNRHQPEENSFEISNDLSYYRVQFNEPPSVDLMSGNRVPEPRTRRTSGTRETSDGKANQENEKPREDNLHNPLVIALSAAVVCLSIYIVWLKYKN
ncbi:pollen-specific leucine-rich repeat extensin-like protein 2 isoform X2 [Rana temporaria]|uniref:pollen-specific leucine-rich repeat extensin-like protein 2 isoform X2 n=1 Tax=Rana temporaria TaxID=8407 RepID=UPI001AAD911D|nr:pollen-specific leucine-rich repeat extensin-like protein 2 isoform X2 [Rana temporaria]